jgi:hypothetical protein
MKSMACVVRRETALHFTDSSAGHVRAASSLARVPGGIAVLQDDASVIAVHDPARGTVRFIPLPHEVEGTRVFDDERGNKAHKLDLEACVMDDATGMLIAFGSGSTPRRESIIAISDWTSPAPTVRLIDARALYHGLREPRAFAGSALNIEGAIHIGDRLRFFGRGNGARDGNEAPVNATCDVDWSRFRSYLEDPDHVAPPVPTDITRYDLGTLDGVALGFTDAALWSSRNTVLFVAAAEDSPDAVRDGRVAGSAIGVIDAAGVRWAPLLGPDGALYPGKAEGILPPEDGADSLRVVIDPDDHRVAALLCEVEFVDEDFIPRDSF